MIELFRKVTLLVFVCLIYACSTVNNEANNESANQHVIQTLRDSHNALPNKIWLSHEHLLVDFIGAEKITIEDYDHDKIIEQVLPYLTELKQYNVDYFVDATPKYIGRDVSLLAKLSQLSGIKIVTNTGFYGARNNQFIPDYVTHMSPNTLANIWVDEYVNGIDGTTIKPGFIKIGVDSAEKLEPIDAKLVEAAGITHLKTGLTIASHTGNSQGLWPQLNLLEKMGVPLSAFIWVHAYAETNNDDYLKAAKRGCWISLDGLGWEIDNHVEKLLFAKKHGILDKILISSDAGWYDPQKDSQKIIPYTKIFTELKTKLKAKGFTDEEFMQLITTNPAKAFIIKKQPNKVL